jgi:hypothetical protein
MDDDKKYTDLPEGFTLVDPNAAPPVGAASAAPPAGFTDITPVNPPGSGGVFLNPGGGAGALGKETATPTEEKEEKPEPPGAFKRAVTNYWDQVNPLNTGQGILNLFQNPKGVAQGYMQQNQQLLDRAQKSWEEGDYGNAAAHAFHYMLNGIPGVGASLDKAGDQLESGDIAGGLGTSAGLATNLYYGAKTLKPRLSPAEAAPLKLNEMPEPVTEDAIRQRAHEISQARQSGDPTSDWLQAEKELKTPPPKPAAPPAAQVVNAAAKNSIGALLKQGAGGFLAGEAINLLTHGLTNNFAGGYLTAKAIKYIPTLLRSDYGQQMLARIGSGTASAARTAAVARDMTAALNTLYKSQEQPQKPPTETFSLPPSAYIKGWAAGGAVDPELARIQRARLRLPGIVEMLAKGKGDQ